MKLIACLSVYNEIQFIERVLTGLSDNDIDRAIAVDGAYQGFPHQSWQSTDGTLETLRRYQAISNGWLQLIEAPAHGWVGQEVKRTVYFRAADAIAEPGDWLIQVDGDEELIADGAVEGRRLRDCLESLPESVTTVYVAIRDCQENRDPGGWDYWAKVYRWLPGLRYGREHWRIRADGGRIIWNEDMTWRSPNAALWPHFQFNHWSDARSKERKDDKGKYEVFRKAFREQHGAMNPIEEK